MTLPIVRDADPRAPRLLNPLSAEHGTLRTALVPSLVAQVEANWSTQIGDVRLFEVGTVFAGSTPGDRPHEALHAGFVVTGARQPAHWTAAGKAAPWDAWDVKALFEGLVALAQPSATVQVDGGRWIATDGSGAIVGWCGVVGADAPPWAAPVYGGEITIAEGSRGSAVYRTVPAFPAIVRDLALLVPLTRPVVDVTSLLSERGARYGLESTSVVDEYRGSSLPAGMRSIAIRLVFRAADRTLTDTEVEQAIGRLRASLERELDITLRSS
jgi:phenylalanyl-tRNA synthetase beta chain